MPLLVLLPIVAAVSGGAGFWAGSTTNKLIVGAAFLGGGYLVYKLQAGK